MVIMPRFLDGSHLLARVHVSKSENAHLAHLEAFFTNLTNDIHVCAHVGGVVASLPPAIKVASFSGS